MNYFKKNGRNNRNHFNWLSNNHNGILTKATTAKESSRGGEVKEIVALEVANNTGAEHSGGTKKTRAQVIDELHEQGKLTDEEVATLEEIDIVVIGGITVDFSALGSAEDNLELQEVPEDFWIVSDQTAYINTKYINFPGNTWTYGTQVGNQPQFGNQPQEGYLPGECQKTRLDVPATINGVTIEWVFLGNVNNIVYLDISKISGGILDPTSFLEENRSSLKGWIAGTTMQRSCGVAGNAYYSWFKDQMESMYGEEGVAWTSELDSENRTYTITLK